MKNEDGSYTGSFAVTCTLPDITKINATNVVCCDYERANNGAGLGLSICYELIQRLGGTININSDEGKGTTVWFSIPCQALEIERA